MTQEEKAKRYDEVVKGIKGFFEGKQKMPNDVDKTLELLFPELKESEDEKIRKELIGFLRNIPNSNYTCEEMALWLEKQGIRPRYNIGDILCDKLCTTLNKDAQPNMEIVDIKNGMYICDKGSFPVSQQDEYVLVGKKIDLKPVDSVSNELREASLEHARNEMMSTTFPNNMTFEFAYNFEEGAKWQAAQKSTWSKEDEKERKRIIGLLEGWLSTFKDTCYAEDCKCGIVWLKSLKDRCTWKPSDEQMDALEYHLKHTNENSRLYKETKKLYEQLKKLK